MSSRIKIGIIGDYEANRPSHIATNEALYHSANYLNIEIENNWVPTESLVHNVADQLKEFHGLWCAPGSPYKSMIGAINGIQFAREHKVPFIGTCGGFQHAVLEYAKNVLGLIEINEELDPYNLNIFISALSCSLIGETKRIILEEESKTYKIYQTVEIKEQYNCQFGLNPESQKSLEDNGFRITGRDENNEARILELTENNFYMATLFQPQLSSTFEKPHKLINEFLRYALLNDNLIRI